MVLLLGWPARLWKRGWLVLEVESGHLDGWRQYGEDRGRRVRNGKPREEASDVVEST
jgi:hypothetical protein